MTIHVTPIPRVIDLAAPGFTLGTTNAAGTAETAVASDSTILVFDATVPTTIAYGASAAAGSGTTASYRSHTHGMADLFDSGVATTIAYSATAAAGDAAVASRRNHTHGMVAEPSLSSKTLSFVRTASSGAGDQAITGADFAPTAIIFLGVATAETIQGSIGVADSAAGEVGMRAYGTTPVWGEVSQVVNISDGTDSMSCVLKTLDADGFTVTWSKGNSGINATVKVLCMR